MYFDQKCNNKIPLIINASMQYIRNMMDKIKIDDRFRGPPDSGNGGYSCGVVANFVNGPAEVKLLRPPPINRSLNIEKFENRNVVASDETGIIAEAIPTEINIEIPNPPTFAEAKNAEVKITPDVTQHPFIAECFACGPKRKEADGLRLFPGLVKGRNYVATTWIPDASLTDDHDILKNEMIWAALDCTGAWGFVGGWTVADPKSPIFVLGKFAVQIISEIDLGTKLIVIGWEMANQGRKIIAGSALFSEAGQLCAKAKATWIQFIPKSVVL